MFIFFKWEFTYWDTDEFTNENVISVCSGEPDNPNTCQLCSKFRLQRLYCIYISCLVGNGTEVRIIIKLLLSFKMYRRIWFLHLQLLHQLCTECFISIHVMISITCCFRELIGLVYFHASYHYNLFCLFWFLKSSCILLINQIIAMATKHQSIHSEWLLLYVWSLCDH